MARWQKGRKRKSKFSLKIIALVIIGIALVNLTFKFSGFISNIQKPLSTEFEKSFPGPNFNYRVNILLLGSSGTQVNQVALASFSINEDNSMDLLPIPLSSSKELQLVSGEKETIDKAKDLLGLPIDGFINFSEFSGTFSESEVKSFKNSLGLSNIPRVFDLYSYLNQKVKTSLSLKDLIVLMEKLSKIRDDRISEINIDELKVGDYLEKSLIDSFAQRSLTQDLILNEGAKIDVRNATGANGAAYKASRIISNVGGTVINIANHEEDFMETTIYAYFDRPKTVEYLARVFKAKVIREKDEDARADLMVVIGKDFLPYQEKTASPE